MCHYQTLGVKQNAKNEEIKRAYYKLMLKTHPDKINTKNNTYNKTKFTQIQNAYIILSDKIKRNKYDEELMIYNMDELIADAVDAVCVKYDFDKFYINMAMNITRYILETD